MSQTLKLSIEMDEFTVLEYLYFLSYSTFLKLRGLGHILLYRIHCEF